jgi:hypothetical protein
MKANYILLFLCLIISSYPQADLSINLRISDNATPPNNGSWEITFGLDSTATDGLDTHLGESYVPPDGCCGWGTGLCAAFQLPTNPNSVWKDYRFAELPYSIIKEHRIWYCAHSSSTVITFQCDLPEGVTALLQDLITGNLIHIELADSNEYYITSFIGVGLKLTVNYQTIVPVELVSFTAFPQNNSVNLNWQTAVETNNSGFQIERRKPLDERNDEWKVVGFVSGSGTTTEPQSYEFVDKSISSGKYMYRLKQIDYDGTFMYSNEIEVEVDIAPKEFVLHQNYPNPFNPNTTIEYELPLESYVRIILYNILGEKIKTLFEGEKKAGTYELKFASEQMPSGIYFYSLETNKSRAVKKLTILK